jgi:N-acetylated-alpha-linked acidic dipeptidase
MPVAFQAALAEDPTDLDIDTHAADAVGPYLAFAADGDVTGPLVYVNRGTQKDFADLRAAGIDPRGAIGIVRYGDVYRGAKLLNAQAAGLAGLLIYSDPADDGYVRGLGYPQGPWRPESAVQRGSVLDIALAPGDPLTPGEPSIPTVDRLDLEDVAGLPRIPALPLSWRDARPLLEALDGQTVPATWQGGLPFTYHVGGTGTTLVRLRVRSDWRIRRIWNVIGLLKGSAFPDAWIVAGAHRDAWVHGAADPGSGTTVLVEAARVLGNLARTGLRPSRSIVFCSSRSGCTSTATPP